MTTVHQIPVVDLFAGPGGLGEGFASCHRLDEDAGEPLFHPVLSIEKDADAHRTLLLRSFFRQYSEGQVPSEYYRLLTEEKATTKDLYDQYPEAATSARQEAVQLTLGPKNHPKTRELVRQAVDGAEDHWVLIGGPPCQAYSIAGRVRNRSVKGYRAEEDQRHFLYEEFLRVLADFHPPVFVLENVKGLLSATVKNKRILTMMQADLSDPVGAVQNQYEDQWHQRPRYRLYSLSHEAQKPLGDLSAQPVADPSEYILKMENYGVPQTRHRLIILGVRDDRVPGTVGLLDPSNSQDCVSVSETIFDLPELRSGLSRGRDSDDSWRTAVLSARQEAWFSAHEREHPDDWAEVRSVIDKTLSSLTLPEQGRGGEFVEHEAAIDYRPEWFSDPRLSGIWNHVARSHMRSDLHRYLFAAAFASLKDRSPVLSEFPRDSFPDGLLPNHSNVREAIEKGNYFSDRFRVQVAHKPAKTVTSHISKDGHYYIHPDPGQCRSLTVREAARLQTFPDNYLFIGSRTSQYAQVGNAVPPLVSAQIAQIAYDILGS